MVDCRIFRFSQIVLALVLVCGVPVGAQQTDPYGQDYSPPYDSGPAPRRQQGTRQTPDDLEGYRRRPDRGAPYEPDNANAASRERLLDELRKIRKPTHETKEPKDTNFSPPLPQRRKLATPAQAIVENTMEPLRPAAGPATPAASTAAPAAAAGSTAPVSKELEQLLSQRLMVQFSGTQPGEGGPKAVRALIQAGQIAGVVADKNNVMGKAQLRELLKFFAQAGDQLKPFIAAREIGGSTTSFTFDKGFEPWPSQQEIAARRDPQYSYSIYQTLSSNLEYLGFNMNFGPRISLPDGPAGPADSFAGDPLQIAVYAKTFIIGHSEAGIISVPILDVGDKPIQSLKALLVSYPDTPVAASQSPESTSFQNYTSLIRGARFCFVSGKAEAASAEIPESFRRGCDMLVLTATNEPPPVIRQRAIQTVASALQKGELTMAQLTATSHRIEALRATLATH